MTADEIVQVLAFLPARGEYECIVNEARKWVDEQKAKPLILKRADHESER